MTLNRETSFELYESDTGNKDPEVAIYPIKEVQEGAVCRDCGRLSVASAATETLELPVSYTDADDLLCYFKVNGEVEFTIESPSHADSIIYANGPITFTDKITSITIKGVEDSVVEYTLIGVNGVEREFS